MAHLLEMKNICKSFSGVSVLKDNHLELEAGEVHALLGENGAGKSTLIKILGGVYTKDSGQILVDGQEVEITGVESAKEHGIRIIHQELMLIPDMTISENIFIGQEPKTKAGTVDKKKMNEMAQGFLDSMHLELKSTQFIRDLNIAQQQMVEIIRAISFGAKIIVMDEPTSSLTENEVDALFEAIRALKAKNVGIIYISHRMAELDAITDRITVMRDGEYIDTVVTKETTHDDLVALMVGRKLGDLYQKHENYSDDIILKVENLASGKEVKNVNFELRRGEVLGFSGLVGSGRSETMECIFGLRHKDSGHIYIENEEVDIKNVKTAINAGIGLVPEDRKQSGIYPIQGIRFNATIEILDKFLKKGRYNRKKEIELARKYVDEVGTMNVMFLINDTIVTAALEGTVLPGVTRDSILHILRDWGYKVEERNLSIDELMEAGKTGALKEAWGTGTAAVISPIGELCYKGDKVTINNFKTGELTQKLFDTLTGIQWGRLEDKYNWTKILK